MRKEIIGPDGRRYEIKVLNDHVVHIPQEQPPHYPTQHPGYPPSPYQQQPMMQYGGFEQKRHSIANALGVLVAGFFIGIVGGMAIDVTHPQFGAVFAWGVWGMTIVFGLTRFVRGE